MKEKYQLPRADYDFILQYQAYAWTWSISVFITPFDSGLITPLLRGKNVEIGK